MVGCTDGGGHGRGHGGESRARGGRKTGAILLLLTSNPGKVTEKQIVEGLYAPVRSVWITWSTDDGATWSPPSDITAAAKRAEWSWYATGP